MNGTAVAIVAILVVGGLLGFVLLGNPFTETIIEGPGTPVAGVEFGTGNIHQIKPTDVRIRVANSHLEIPPAEWTIEVYNGKSIATIFRLSYREPGDLWPGYQSPPAGVASWLEFPQTIVVEPKSIGTARVALTIPSGAVPKDTDFEFWIVVGEVSGSSIVTEVAVRWLVEIR